MLRSNVKSNKNIMNNVVNLHALSVYDVMATMSELQTGKAVRPDGIPIEAFVYGGRRLAVLLCLFFQRVPWLLLLNAFTSSVIVNIIKNKAGQLSVVNNYRAIAIANACSKLLESIMYIMYKYTSTIDGYVNEDPYRFDFKRSHSTDLCTYVFKNTVRYYTSRSRNRHVFTYLVDFHKTTLTTGHWQIQEL